MRGWKGACRNHLREELYYQLASVRTDGGDTAEACTKPDSRLIVLIRHAHATFARRFRNFTELPNRSLDNDSGSP